MSDAYEFTLLAIGVDLQTDEALNALAAAGCDDATVGSSGGFQHLDFDREADSYVEAVLSAVNDVEAALPGIRVVRILPDEYVALAEIAERTGRTRESVRLLSIGERGPGNFPPPAARRDERNKLWRWSDVALWFASDLREGGHESVPWAVQRALNAVLDLRTMASELEATQLTSLRTSLTELTQIYRLRQVASPAALDVKNEKFVNHAQSA